jgi:hypothetical protein
MDHHVARLEQQVKWYRRVAVAFCALTVVGLCIAANQALPGTFTIIGTDGKSEVIVLNNKTGDVTASGGLSIKGDAVVGGDILFNKRSLDKEFKQLADRIDRLETSGILRIDEYPIKLVGTEYKEKNVLAVPGEKVLEVVVGKRSELKGAVKLNQLGKNERVTKIWLTPHDAMPHIQYLHRVRARLNEKANVIDLEVEGIGDDASKKLHIHYFLHVAVERVKQ